MTIDDTVKILHENESVYVPCGARHCLENPGKIDLELIEVQTGSYLSVRIPTKPPGYNGIMPPGIPE